MNTEVYHTPSRNVAEDPVVDSHSVAGSIRVLGFLGEDDSDGDGDAVGRHRV